MLLRFSLFAALFVASSHAEEVSLPTCPLMTEETLPVFHQSCNRVEQNSPERRRQRIQRHERLQATKAYPLIPTQKTVVCPLEPVDLSSSVTGQDTRWIVENKSSGRVVLAFLMNGVEYSATNPKMAPPQSDPRAVLEPGEFKVLKTFEGHVFHARELLEDGSAGNVLLQHRPGVVEMTNRFGQELDCGQGMVDEEEEEEEEYRTAFYDAMVNENDSPQLERSPTTRHLRKRQKMERCNLVYQGFRNTLPNCPLDIYYAGVDQGAIANGPMQCQEKLKFHLGTDHQDNTDDEGSSLKYEAIFVGHQFVARLASDPDIVVDTFTLEPTEIHDCPRRKQPPVVQEQVIEFNGIQNGNANLENSTATLGDVMISVDAPSGVLMIVLSSS